jgi:hypothetical protein
LILHVITFLTLFLEMIYIYSAIRLTLVSCVQII